MKCSVRQLPAAVALAAAMIIGSEDCVAQEVAAEPEVIPANATRCQRNTINIFGLGSILSTNGSIPSKKSEKVFVIARLGSGEASRRLSRRRLRDVKTEFGNNWDPHKIILAEGSRIKGQGRVEFYLGSELWFVSLIPRNADFCSLCCDRKRVFYPMSLTAGRRPGKGWWMKIGNPPRRKTRNKRKRSC